MLALIMGIAAAFNILVIFKKVELARYQDAFFDSAFLVILTLIFGSTLGGMMVATVASAIISIYFLFNPPTFLQTFNKGTADNEELDEILEKYNIK